MVHPKFNAEATHITAYFPKKKKQLTMAKHERLPGFGRRLSTRAISQSFFLPARSNRAVRAAPGLARLTKVKNSSRPQSRQSADGGSAGGGKTERFASKNGRTLVFWLLFVFPFHWADCCFFPRAARPATSWKGASSHK